jgi:GMP synthase-like glutamine amidotransferase
MAVVVFLHHPQEGPCLLGEVLRDRGRRLEFVHLYRGQPVPGELDEVEGVLSMGGPMNVDQAGEHPWMHAEMEYLRKAHAGGVPIVGVCLGAQLLAQALGGQVGPMPRPPGPEIGFHPLKLGFAGTVDPLLAGIPWSPMAFHIHGQEATKLPPEAVLLASSKMCKNQAFRVGLKTYGFQYHFEWNRDDLVAVARDPFVAQANLTAQQIIDSVGTYYDSYEHVAARLRENIATLLVTGPVKLRV